MLDNNGLIRSWSYPFIFVKNDGELCFSDDDRKLNAVTKKDSVESESISGSKKIRSYTGIPAEISPMDKALLYTSVGPTNVHAEQQRINFWRVPYERSFFVSEKDRVPRSKDLRLYLSGIDEVMMVDGRDLEGGSIYKNQLLASS
ncbi:12203_t:CDS:2, partial [Ambispora gerdemannii]